MPKLSATTKQTAYWMDKKVDYYFDRSAQFVLNGHKKKRNGLIVTSSECSPCSCGIGGCGDGGGCDGY